MSVEDIEKLKRNNQELQEIINNSWDGIGIIDKSTNLIYVNNAFMPILGFTKDELVNKQFTTFMKNEYIKPFVKLLDINNHNTKYKAEIDIVCIRKDNEKVYLKTTIASMINKPLFVINIKDITSQISDDEILDDYVSTMHLDLHLYITKVSSALLKLNGYNKNEIIGKPLSFLSHKDTQKVVLENINKSLQALHEWSGNIKCQKKDGNAVWLNIKIKPVYNKYGDVTGYTSLLVDVSNELNLKNESVLLEEQSKLAKEQLIEKNNILAHQSKLSVMTETLQKLSHEWRQPLNIISIQAQKLELEYSMSEQEVNEEHIKSLEKIKKEADLLSNTIQNFQSFINSETKVQKTCANIIIEKAISLSQIKQIKIEKDFEDLDFLVLENELVTVLVNLLKNSSEQIQRTNTKNPIIKLSQYHNDDKIVFEVSDNAGGINSEILHKIFEPYFSTKEKRHGVGLGLYTSKLIVELQLKGIISAFNNDLGATFKISIPKEGNII